MKSFEKLQEIFRDVFDAPDMEITRATSSEDVEDWDSLAQMQIIAATEAEFGIRFTIDEAVSFNNIGDLIDCIERKL